MRALAASSVQRLSLVSLTMGPEATLTLVAALRDAGNRRLHSLSVRHNRILGSGECSS